MRIEEIHVGAVAELAKTVTESDIALFAGVTGDFNPVHIDAEAAKKSVFGERIAHGMLSAGFISAVIGTRLPGPGSIYVSQTLNFMAPVLIGETITAVATITAIDEKRRRVVLKTQCLNGDKVVIDGEATILVPRRDVA